MRKTEGTAADSGARGIPSMERLLSAGAFAPLIADYSREAVKLALRRHLAKCRAYDEANALRDVNRMIEIREIRQVVNANPLERLAGLETCAHRFEIGTVRPNLFVAIHTDCRRGYSR